MLVFKASAAAVDSLCFTPDGRGLVTGAGGGAAVYDLTSMPKLVNAYDLGGAAHTFAVAVSPCGRFLAFSAAGVWVIDFDSGHEFRLREGRTKGLAFAPDGRELAAPAFTPQQWAVPSWDEVVRPEPRPGRQEFCTGGLGYTSDGQRLGLSFASLSADGSRYDSCVVLFDRGTGELAGRLMMPFGHAHPTRIAFRPDGAVVAGNFGPVLGVVSVTDGSEVARLKLGAKHLTDLAFTPDGTRLVAVGNDARVRLFDARTWTELEGYEWQVGKLRSVAIAPDGLRMAAGGATGKVVIWDV